jgi:hypothetical protein
MPVRSFKKLTINGIDAPGLLIRPQGRLVPLQEVRRQSRFAGLCLSCFLCPAWRLWRRLGDQPQHQGGLRELASEGTVH